MGPGRPWPPRRRPSPPPRPTLPPTWTVTATAQGWVNGAYPNHGFLLIGPIAQYYGWRPAFLMVGLLAFAVVLVVASTAAAVLLW